MSLSATTAPRRKSAPDAVHGGTQLAATVPALQPVRASRGHTVTIPKFGCYSPRWTIGSSRKAPKHQDTTPGPGEYDVDKSMRSPHVGRCISPRRERNYRTLTSDIDFPNLRQFPAQRRFSVGNRSDTMCCMPAEKTGEYMGDLPTLSTRSHKISSRREERPNDNPGPGTYSPEYKPAPMLTTISRRTDREIFKPAEPDTPGPGSYDLVERLRTPRWFARMRVTRKSD